MSNANRNLLIRLAEPTDLAGVMELLTAFHAENGIAPLKPEKVERQIMGLIGRSDLFLAEHNQALVGLLGIEDNELNYSDHHVLVDSYFFVTPSHRGKTVGARLMQAATLEAERRSLPLYIRVNNPDRARKRGRIGEIAGYIPIGYVVRLR